MCSSSKTSITIDELRKALRFSLRMQEDEVDRIFQQAKQDDRVNTVSLGELNEKSRCIFVITIKLNAD